MLIQCITLMLIQCITCITLNYCLTEIVLLKKNCIVLNPEQEIDPMKDLFLQLFAFTFSLLFSVYEHAI